MQLLTLAEIRAAIDNRLEQLFKDKAEPARAVDEVYAQLVEAIGAYLLRPGGGKRLRPYLVYLAYAGYGGTEQAAIIDVASAVELVHAFLLIHDDIIDRDTQRHGGPNLIGEYAERFSYLGEAEARHYADGVALLAGDMAYIYANELIAGSAFEPEQRLVALQQLSPAVLEVAGGELADMTLPLLQDSRPSEARLLRMTCAKTASYSFVLPLQLGATLAGINQAELDCLKRLGTAAGIAFQIADDLLGMFGSPAATGKPVTSDLAEGKLTLVMTYGLEMAAPNQRRILQQQLGNREVDAAGHAEVKTILERCGAKQRAEALAADYVAEAETARRALGLNPEAAEALKSVLQKVVHRVK
jgi:geranylgeranyl pyrophosphate synthase